jgi:predicted transcriptional regulator
MEIQLTEDEMSTVKKVLMTFEMDEKQRKQLKKLADRNDRSMAYVLRKLAEQAIQMDTYELIAIEQKPVRIFAGVKG